MSNETDRTTPRPWGVGRYGNDVDNPTTHAILAEFLDTPITVALLGNSRHEPRSVDTVQANAALIVRAVNSHEALVAACEKMIEWAEWGVRRDIDLCADDPDENYESPYSADVNAHKQIRGDILKARAALALARGEQPPAAERRAQILNERAEQ